MKHYLLVVALLFTAVLKAQGIYDLETIQDIRITFAESNWDELLDDEYAGAGGYIMAQSVSINGVSYDSVGVKYKGNSTYRPTQTKNPFHIELDTYIDQEHEGYTDIKLANGYNDPSCIREVLSYYVLRQYMDAPLSNFANVYVNGTLIGLYSNSESISKKFVDKRFYSNDNEFFKCSPPDGAGPGTSNLPNLVYLGPDSANYYGAYEIKSDNGWQSLIDLCDTLENHINSMEEILDVDRAIWMLAYDNVLVNLDSYIGRFNQNYYLYRDDNRRFLPVVWDLNESFGRFADTGDGPLTSTTAKQQMNHLLHAGDPDFPLVSQLLSDPMYKRMYLAHFKTILLENFANSHYDSVGQALQSTIDAAVLADGNKFYSYADFIANLNSDVSTGGGPMAMTAPGITNLMDGRSAYLLGLTDFTQTEPTIANIVLSNPTPDLTETITITASIADAGIAYLGYRSQADLPFTRILMYDDGAHNDGAAGDGVYGVDITVESASTQYYIYAENSNIGKFSPVRAEHEFHTIALGTTASDAVINELMASNDVTAADQDGEFDDWIELYNTGPNSIDLSGYGLSDRASNLEQWTFPAGTIIEADGYLIVWADDDTDQDGLHADFKLSASLESVYLWDASGGLVDYVSFTSQSTDVAFARIPNGTGDFQTASPTFNGNNDEATAIETVQPEVLALHVYPNPARDVFNVVIEGSLDAQQEVLVYSIRGDLMYRGIAFQQIAIPTADWASGMYVVRVGSTFRKLVVL